MYVSYATAMDLASGSIDLAAEVVREWLEDAGLGRLDLSRDDRTRLRNVEARSRVDPRHALELELVERGPSGSASTTAVHLAGEQRKDRAVIVRTQSMPSGSPELLGLADAPAVVPSLLRALDAMDGDLVVLPDPVVFSTADIDALVDELTEHWQRRGLDGSAANSRCNVRPCGRWCSPQTAGQSRRSAVRRRPCVRRGGCGGGRHAGTSAAGRCRRPATRGHPS